MTDQRSAPFAGGGGGESSVAKNKVSFPLNATSGGGEATTVARPQTKRCCPCKSTFQSSEQVLGAIQSDADTSNLVQWLSGEDIREEGRDFLLIRQVSDNEPHADAYGRCPARVGAAFAILNAIRDGCRIHLDRQQQQSNMASSSGSKSTSSLLPLGPSAVAACFAPTDLTSPVKPRYEEDFPRLSGSAGNNAAKISTASPSSSAAAPANVLIPRKKKKRVQPTKVASISSGNDAAARLESNIPKTKPVQQQRQPQANAKASMNVKKTPAQKKKRIRPVPLATSTQSSLSPPWPVAASTSVATLASDVTRKGNIVNLPSEDCLLNVKNKSPSKKSCWEGGSASATAAEISGSQANACARPPPGFGSRVDNDTGKAKEVQPRKLDGSFANSEQDVKLIKAAALVDSSKGVTPDNDGATTDIDDESLDRIVDIYTTLVLHQLVPSVPLELHLLVRLLSLTTSSGTNTMPLSERTSEGTSAGLVNFRRVFSTPQVCRDFASRALVGLESPILTSLSPAILRKIVELPSMNEVLPDVARKLRRIADEGSRVLDRADSLEGAVAVVKITGASNTPFLTVPFDENRDSKHNYRSRDRTLLFNNREESRDKFMFQLRAFQEIRGTVLDPAQADIYISDIKIACRDMIHGLLPGNMAWFAGLFSDLLLQIGLVAVEETDKDVLKQVADKDRLKKLHRRFTAKGGQKNRSSQKLVLGNSKNASSASASSLQPEDYFSGHQEFFFIFLRAVDSYQFGIHLRQRLVGLISVMNVSADARGLERRVLRIQLLAKFLGMLVFSPNWNSTSADASAVKSNVAVAADSKEALAHLNCTTPVIDVKEYIEESWRSCRLVVTVPWVVEFLRMASWDTMSLQASYYQKVFALLRSIHRRLGQILKAKGPALNLQLVLFQLEVLFADVIGLVKAEGLPLVILPERGTLSSTDADGDMFVRLDMIPLHFTKLYLFASSSYLEEFYKLISDFVENKGKTATGRVGASKKLRPYAITAQVGGDESTPSPFSKQMKSVNGTLGSSTISPLNLISPQKGVNNRRNTNSIQDKLVDAFFHQHNDLQQVCEFVVEKSVKNSLSIVVKDHVTPYFAVAADDFDDAFDSFLKMIRQKEQGALAAATEEMKAQCNQRVRESIRLLSPPETKAAVLDIARKLAIRHAQEKGEEHVQSIVRQEAQKRIDEYIKAEAAKKRTKPPARSVSNVEATAGISSLAQDLRAAAAELEQIRRDETPRVVLESNQTLFRNLSASLSTTLLPNNVVWKEYCVIEEDGRKFISSLLAVLGMWFSAPIDERKGYPPLFLDAITSSICLAKAGIPYYGLKRIGKCVCKHARHLVAWDESSYEGISSEVDDDASSRGQAPNIFTGMLEAQMITPRILDEALNSILDTGSWGKEVAIICLASRKTKDE